jgi:hypothetical protein
VTALRTLAFAELETPTLGVAWIPDGGAAAVVACRLGSDVRTATGRFNDGPGGEPWAIEGDEISLLLRPIGSAARGGSADAGFDSIDQLCEVTGTLLIDGDEREISCIGSRTSLEAGFELTTIDSFRQAAGWFEGPEGVSLLAYRPGKARGQDGDFVAGAVLDAEPAPPVVDPRLSTTYDAAGLPARVGLELWFEDDPSVEEPGGDEQRQFPRRAAGEAVGDPIAWEVAGFRLHGALLRWHSRGNNGAGAYLLGQRG